MTTRFRQAGAMLLGVLFLACGGSQPNYEVKHLPSGKDVKVLGVGKMYFSRDEPALMLKYLTDVAIDDEDALQKEVDEIWPFFRVDVEKAQLRTAIISANEPPTGVVISESRAFTFVFKKADDGTWLQQ